MSITTKNFSQLVDATKVVASGIKAMAKGVSMLKPSGFKISEGTYNTIGGIDLAIPVQEGSSEGKKVDIGNHMRKLMSITTKTLKEAADGTITMDSAVNTLIEVSATTTALLETTNKMNKTGAAGSLANNINVLRISIDNLKSYNKLLNNKSIPLDNSDKSFIKTKMIIEGYSAVSKMLTGSLDAANLFSGGKLVKSSTDAAKNAISMIDDIVSALNSGYDMIIKPSIRNDTNKYEDIFSRQQDYAKNAKNAYEDVAKIIGEGIIKKLPNHSKNGNSITIETDDIVNLVGLDTVKPKKDANKKTLARLKIKNKKLNDKLEAIKGKEESLKNNKNNLSDMKRDLDYNKRVMIENKLTKKEKLLIMAQKILYSAGNHNASPMQAWRSLSKTKRKQLASIYKSLGFYSDKGNATASLSISMANYIGKNNREINRLKNKKHRYLEAYSWNQGTKYSYSSIVKTIANLKNEIKSLNNDIAPLENDIASLMNQIVDTSDYLNDQKNNLTNSADTASIPLTGYIDVSKSSLYTSIQSGIVVTESSGHLDTLSLGVGTNPLLNSGTFTKKADNGYSYVSWGAWASSNVKYIDYQGNTQNLGNYVGQTNNVAYYGQRTAINDIPTTGSAVYNGEAIGYIKSSNTAVSGTVQILANFADSSISGSININNFANTNINGHIGGIYTGESAAYSKTIDGTLSGTNLKAGAMNTMNAQFYGKGAAEMGGIWKITKTNNEEASGIFRAKK